MSDAPERGGSAEFTSVGPARPPAGGALDVGRRARVGQCQRTAIGARSCGGASGGSVNGAQSRPGSCWRRRQRRYRGAPGLTNTARVSSSRPLNAE